MRQSASVRVAAAASLLASCAFVAALGFALIRTPAFTATDFLSGLGAKAAPAAAAYRLAIGCVALSAALLGVGLRRAYPHVAVRAYLAGAAALLGMSALLPCDAGCPIPVVESGGGVVNALHFFSTAASFVLVVLAMYRVSSGCPDPGLRRLSLAAMVLVGVLMAVLAVLLLFATHSVVSAAVERVLLLGAFGWLVVSSALLLLRRPAPQGTRAAGPR